MQDSTVCIILENIAQIYLPYLLSSVNNFTLAPLVLLVTKITSAISPLLLFAPALRGSRHSSHNQEQIPKEIWLWDKLACPVYWWGAGIIGLQTLLYRERFCSNIGDIVMRGIWAISVQMVRGWIGNAAVETSVTDNPLVQVLACWWCWLGEAQNKICVWNFLGSES